MDLFSRFRTITASIEVPYQATEDDVASIAAAAHNLTEGYCIRFEGRPLSGGGMLDQTDITEGDLLEVEVTPEKLAQKELALRGKKFALNDILSSMQHKDYEVLQLQLAAGKPSSDKKIMQQLFISGDDTMAEIVVTSGVVPEYLKLSEQHKCLWRRFISQGYFPPPDALFTFSTVNNIDFMLDECGLDLTARSLHGLNMLHFCAKKNVSALLEKVIQRGKIPINSEIPATGETPLALALQKGTDAVSVLLNAGADINYTPVCSEYGAMQPLMYLSSPVHYELLEKHNADFTMRSCRSSETMMHAAVRRFPSTKGKEYIDVLRGKGLGLEDRNVMGSTPLHIAMRIQNPGWVRLLLEMGADPMARDNEGNTILHFNHTSDEILETIVMGVEDVDVQNDKGDTPLHIHQDANVARLLVKRCSLTIYNCLGVTPLHLLYKRTIEFSSVLLENNAKLIDFPDDSMHRTPLHYAVVHESWSIMSLLLDRGADPQIADRMDNNVLHFIAESKPKPGFVCRLFNLDIHNLLDMKNKWGDTPLDLASTQYFEDLWSVTLLKQEKCQ